MSARQYTGNDVIFLKHYCINKLLLWCFYGAFMVTGTFMMDVPLNHVIVNKRELVYMVKLYYIYGRSHHFVAEINMGQYSRHRSLS